MVGPFPAPGEPYAYRGFTFTASRREWSAIRNVARSTATNALQRGHFGVVVLPETPSR